MIINGLEVGQVVGFPDEMMLTAALAREHARWIEKAGADAIMVRSHWLGYHVPGYLTDLLFYPEPPIPLENFPPEYYAKEKGVGANTLPGRRHQEGSLHPGHRGGPARRRLRGAAAGGGRGATSSA